MTKLEIYNIALSVNGKRATKEELNATVKPTEVDACDSMYKIAIETVLGECDWSFFVKPITLNLEDDQPHGKWQHGYSISDSEVYRIARVDAGERPYAFLGNRFYTNERDPQLWGITSDALFIETAPRDFCMLIGLYLGFLVSQVISPSDTALAQRILQSYSGQLSSAMRRERNNMNLNYLEDGDWSAKQ